MKRQTDTDRQLKATRQKVKLVHVKQKTRAKKQSKCAKLKHKLRVKWTGIEEEVAEEVGKGSKAGGVPAEGEGVLEAESGSRSG